jgi:glycosyltransferase involved in cell wall biosynthesis
MIAINGKIFTQKMTGLGRFSYEIVKSLIQKGILFQIITPNLPVSIEYIDLQEYIIKDVSFLHPFLWETLRLPFLLDKRKYSALWSPANIGPIFTPIPHFLTIHDLSFSNPHWINKFSYLLYNFFIPNSMKNASKIICVSDFTHQEIKKKYPSVLPEKICWTHSGCNSLNFTIANPLNILPSKEMYFVVLGNIEARKNIYRIIEAWKIYKTQQKSPVKLFIIGSKKKRENFDVDIQDDTINITGYINDEEVVNLLKSARGLIFPSLYEGFGFPILEAMQHGCPVITSNIGAMKEIAGDAAILVDPFSIESISNAIKLLASNDSIYFDFQNKGIDRAKIFRWEKTTSFYINHIFEN